MVIINEFNCFKLNRWVEFIVVVEYEKRYDEYNRLFKPCDSCNAKRALK